MTTTTATTPISDEQLLTMLKHLAAGKNLDQVATISRRHRDQVLDAVSTHGYPKSLAKGIELLTAKIDKDRNTLPAGTAIPEPRTSRPASTSPSSVASPDARPIGHAPDEIRILINTAKSHPAKRIQAQADRVLDGIGKLRDLIAEDQAKNAAKRAEDAAKAAARAEIKRLEQQLADAKAKLKKTPAPGGVKVEVGPDVSAADLRAWAKTQGIDVPDRGRVPAEIREQYAAEHPADNDEQRQDGAA